MALQISIILILDLNPFLYTDLLSCNLVRITTWGYVAITAIAILYKKYESYILRVLKL